MRPCDFFVFICYRISFFFVFILLVYSALGLFELGKSETQNIKSICLKMKKIINKGPVTTIFSQIVKQYKTQ